MLLLTGALAFPRNLGLGIFQLLLTLQLEGTMLSLALMLRLGWRLHQQVQQKYPLLEETMPFPAEDPVLLLPPELEGTMLSLLQEMTPLPLLELEEQRLALPEETILRILLLPPEL